MSRASSLRASGVPMKRNCDGLCMVLARVEGPSITRSDATKQQNVSLLFPSRVSKWPEARAGGLCPGASGAWVTSDEAGRVITCGQAVSALNSAPIPRFGFRQLNWVLLGPDLSISINRKRGAYAPMDHT